MGSTGQSAENKLYLISHKMVIYNTSPKLREHGGRGVRKSIRAGGKGRKYCGIPTSGNYMVIVVVNSQQLWLSAQDWIHQYFTMGGGGFSKVSHLLKELLEANCCRAR